MPPAARDRRGIAAVEIALVTPVLALVLVGSTDFVQYQRTRLRLESTAVQIGQVVSQCNQITAEDVQRFWDEARRIGGSLVDVTSGTGGAIILSAVHRDGARNVVAWQRRAGNTALGSVIGAAGGTATLPNGANVPTAQTMFVVETAARASVWVLSARARLMGERPADTLRGTAFLLSRSIAPAALQQPPSTSTASACMS